MASEVVLVRHGRTAPNAAGLLLGRTDPPLDELGVVQVATLADAVGPVDRVVSSPLARATETAAVFGLPVEVDDRWVEISYGGYEGEPVASARALLQRWRDDLAYEPPGGESLIGVGRRVRAALDELAAQGPGTVVVVSHVSPIKAAVAWALGVGDELAFRTRLDPAAITRLQVTDRGPSLVSFNEVAHLGQRRTAR